MTCVRQAIMVPLIILLMFGLVLAGERKPFRGLEERLAEIGRNDYEKKVFAMFRNHECFESQPPLANFSRSPFWGRVNLSISDFDKTFKPSVNKLGINLEEKTPGEKAIKIRGAFFASVRKHSRLGIKDITEEKGPYFYACLKEKRAEVNSGALEQCSAQAKTRIRAMYGDAVSSLSCHVAIYGTDFPIIALTRCYINANSDMEGRSYEGEFLDVLEPVTLVEGLIRDLDEYVEGMTDIFRIAKKVCKK